MTIRLTHQSVPDEATLREGAELPGYDGELNRAWLAQSAEDRNFHAYAFGLQLS